MEPLKYQTQAYSDEKAKRNILSEGNETNSDLEDEQKKYENLAIFFDKDELKKIQFDEFTSSKSYIKITCERTIDKMEQDFILIDTSLF